MDLVDSDLRPMYRSDVIQTSFALISPYRSLNENDYWV